eukprot:TRINITY_DN163747_c1_g1_i1.p1 TRINITY_DN163747_c1_g1~~TRINITY_DN163747_c1_g1_i1.p1  ORF type:complete len:411 (-),score=100.73 TRINITY_DN163747_c1_g1_i1:171-1403(-)
MQKILWVVSTAIFCIFAGYMWQNGKITTEQYSTLVETLQNKVDKLEKRLADQNLEKQIDSSIARHVEGSKSLDQIPVPKLMTPKRILITGGAGFIGSHLVDALMLQGHEVIVADNMFTGTPRNVAHWAGHPNFKLVEHDIVNPLFMEVDEIYHLACPASPVHYQYNPIKTIKTSAQGTLNMLGLAKRVGAKLLFSSTSEVYGDPTIHPQTEDYWGNVNPIGKRSCYDEGKRVAESMCYAYLDEGHVDVRVARIFNTFGPRMHPDDGRVVSNFIVQALKGEPLTVYGDGSQTRSFQFVTDLVDGLIKLMNSDYSGPVNLGNPEETSILEFANMIKEETNAESEIIFKDIPSDDPHQRKPNINLARKELGWAPQVRTIDGIRETIRYFDSKLKGVSAEQGIWVNKEVKNTVE